MASQGPPPGMGPIMVLSKSKSSIFIFNADNLSFCNWIVVDDRIPNRPLDDMRVPYILHTPHLRVVHNEVVAYVDICMLIHSITFFAYLLKLFFIYPDSKTQRSQGRQAQLGNINAARAVADIIRSTLGPRSMLKVRITMTVV